MLSALIDDSSNFFGVLAYGVMQTKTVLNDSRSCGSDIPDEVLEDQASSRGSELA
jgi:hypothetical protein